MTTFSDFDKLQNALAALVPVTIKAMASSDDDDDDDGETGSGSQGIIVEKVLFAEMFGLQRAAEKHFGPVSDFDQMAYTAVATESQDKGQSQQQRQSAVKKHPILGNLSKFDGDDPKMSMNPQNNDKAQERQQQRNELKLGLQNRPGSAPKPKPGGM